MKCRFTAVFLLASTLLFYFQSIYSQVEKEVTFHAGSKELHSLLISPDSIGPYPAIILLHGSDRGEIDDYKEFVMVRHRWISRKEIDDRLKDIAQSHAVSGEKNPGK
jgi:hypothetical protein